MNLQKCSFGEWIHLRDFLVFLLETACYRCLAVCRQLTRKPACLMWCFLCDLGALIWVPGRYAYQHAYRVWEWGLECCVLPSILATGEEKETGFYLASSKRHFLINNQEVSNKLHSNEFLHPPDPGTLQGAALSLIFSLGRVSRYFFSFNNNMLICFSVHLVRLESLSFWP